MEPDVGAQRRPPGLIGDLADYIYASAVRPALEVAEVAAIGLISGIAGRQFNTVGEPAGLNQYLVLLGSTGIGKEAGKRGIARILAAVRPTVPMIDQFVGPTAFASGQALMNRLGDQPCFFSIWGEVGLTLLRITHPKASGSDLFLMKALHDVWSLSGRDGTVGITAYSDSERNTRPVQSPSVTIIGESTPESFFRCLDRSLIASGLVPRFLVLEYVGDRPPRNERAGFAPDPGVVDRLAALASTVIEMQQKGRFAQVELSPQAKDVLDGFDAEVDDIMNSANADEVLLQIWNRAHLSALKLATAAAVSADWQQPLVQADHAEWAVELVRRSVHTLLGRFERGEAGASDATKAEAEVRKKTVEYLRMSPEERALPKYGIPQAMRTGVLIPWNYFYKRLLAAEVQPFKDKPNLLRETITNLVRGEVLVQLDKNSAWQHAKTRGDVFAVGSNWK
jgi:hypothetical protein